MQTNTFAPVVIFSCQSEPLLKYARRMVELGFFRELEGCYKGQTEPSFMMGAHEFYGQGMDRVLLEDNQESVLFLDNQRNAFLRFAHEAYGEEAQEFLGTFHEVPKASALSREAWTRDPQSGRYFVASK